MWAPFSPFGAFGVSAFLCSGHYRFTTSHHLRSSLLRGEQRTPEDEVPMDSKATGAFETVYSHGAPDNSVGFSTSGPIERSGVRSSSTCRPRWRPPSTMSSRTTNSRSCWYVWPQREKCTVNAEGFQPVSWEEMFEGPITELSPEVDVF